MRYIMRYAPDGQPMHLKRHYILVTWQVIAQCDVLPSDAAAAKRRFVESPTSSPQGDGVEENEHMSTGPRRGPLIPICLADTIVYQALYITNGPLRGPVLC